MQKSLNKKAYFSSDLITQKMHTRKGTFFPRRKISLYYVGICFVLVFFNLAMNQEGIFSKKKNGFIEI